MDTDEQSKPESGPAPVQPVAFARRQLLRGIGWALLPAAAIGFSSCTAPHYDRDRGVFVMRPRK